MKMTLRIANNQILSLLLDYKCWASLALSLGFTILYGSRYLSFSNALDFSVQLTESYILYGSSTASFTATVLGCLLLLSDAPFLSDRSCYEIMRVGTNLWLKSKIVYILLVILLYNFIVFLETTLIGIVSAQVDVANIWSPTVILLAEQNPGFATANFKLYFYYPEFIHLFTPYPAAVITFLFNSAYCFIIVMIIMIVNIYAQNINIGWIVALSVHIIGYVIYMNSALLRLPLSLFTCAMPALLFSETTPLSSIWAIYIYVFTITLIMYFSNRLHSRLIA